MVAAVALLATAATAQVQVEIPYEEVGRVQRSLSVGLYAVQGSVRPGGGGFARLVVHNPDTAPHRLTVECRDPYGSVEVTESVEVGPRSEVTEFVPLPASHYQLVFTMSADRGRAMHVAGVGRTGNDSGVSMLLVTSDGGDMTGWRAVLEKRLQATPAPPAHRGDPRSIAAAFALTPAELPPEWSHLAGFDLVIADGRAVGLDEPAQRTLCDFLRAGGRMLAIHADVMPAGPLQRALAGAPIERGFGTALALDGAETRSIAAGRGSRDFVAWLDASGFLASGTRATSGPLPPQMFTALDIPGLGDVPVRTFFFLILAFALLVGPANYVYWRRRRRLPMLLLTVPAIGLSTTVLLLGYGFLSEGLGVRAAERSLTIVDQVHRQAASWAARTLYAGLGPDVLEPRSGTFVTTLEVQPFRRDSGHKLEILPGGTIGGALVPSRTPTTVATVTVAPERARLRFERAADGLVVPLGGPGLEIAPGAGNLILRTLDGRLWRAREDGRLAVCDEGEARDARDSMIEAFVLAAPAEGHRGAATDGNLGGAETRFLEAFSGEAILPPGHFLGRFEDSPAVDRLRLDGERRGVHLVLGRIGPEDVVD